MVKSVVFETGVVLLCLYNFNVAVGAHHYIISQAERDLLVSVGWNDEGVGRHGVAGG